MLHYTARNKLHCAQSWHKDWSNLSLSPCDLSRRLGQTSISMKLNSVLFQSLFNKFLCESQILKSGKGVKKHVYHGSENCECISFCIEFIFLVISDQERRCTYSLFVYLFIYIFIYLFIYLLTEMISNFLYNVTGMVQIECQGWNEYFVTSDVVKWKHFPHYCPFVRGIHRLLVILRKGPVIWIFVIFSLMIIWTSCCTNNRMASALKHYDAYVTSL